MQRQREEFLFSWLTGQGRKPLVIRGARQVGKTWLVRHLAQVRGLTLLEINFEKRPQFATLFSSNDPQRILLNLSAELNMAVDPEKSLLFLDEIQVAPELFAKLRWFAEDLPQLPVIAAGSLLEFLLADHTFSMPVGRISYMHLEPLSFEEFLLAYGKKELYHYLAQYDTANILPLALHETLMALFKEYIIVGGMPAAVACWVDKKSPSDLNQIHHDIMATYRDDFAKYSKKVAISRLEEVMMAVPMQLGRKFIYSRVNEAVTSSVVKESLELLCKARVCHQVKGCAANGVPLGSELHERQFKAIFLDIGLCTAMLGLSLNKFIKICDVTLVNNGAVAEQLVGQLLRTISPPYIEPSLYYWHREEKGAAAEIDYVIQYGSDIIPIEVKAGKSGSLKSLHLFMYAKGLPLAVRINSDLPSITFVDVKTSRGEAVRYRLLSLPFYLLSQLPRLLSTAVNARFVKLS